MSNKRSRTSTGRSFAFCSSEAKHFFLSLLVIRYCDSRRKVLLDHVHEGYDKDWWLYTEEDAKQ